LAGKSVEERLKEIEALLRELLARIELLERILGVVDEATLRAVRIALEAGLPVSEAVEASLRVLEAAKRLGEPPDPITLALLEAMSDCRLHSVSDLARRVRRIRGTASRTTIRERLRRLHERGLVERKGPEAAPRYKLALC